MKHDKYETIHRIIGKSILQYQYFPHKKLLELKRIPIRQHTQTQSPGLEQSGG